MSPPSKRRGLGRGLSALIPDAGATNRAPTGDGNEGSKDYFIAPIEDIYPSPEQPRKKFDDQLLDELATSIRNHGIIQPLVVRERPDGGGFYLIAGERRWRASQRAGLTEVPVVAQRVSPRDAFERALVENLQRADLNAIEEAESYSRLVSSEFGYTQEQVAERVGKDRTTVANSLRLLKLPGPVREMVEDNKLSMGHARALLGLEDADQIVTAARKVLAESLSVRATEALVRKLRDPAPAPKSTKAQKSASVRDLENRLTKSLGAKVAVQEKPTGKGGKIEIKYADLDDLDRLLEVLLS